jgi:tRNA 2-thiocytidine biosynthesis protein TtcA
MEKLQGAGYYISKKIGKAITDYNMICHGDRIAVAVSGGKDSLTLLEILNARRRFVPVKYELFPIHIDLGYPCMRPKFLAEYFRKNGYDYCIKKIDILRGKGRESISCFWCSWNRRKTIFEIADKLGCKKIALGHHKDDIVQTILLNLFFNGEISAMSPRQELFRGTITLIRPLAYVEENEIVRFAQQRDFYHSRCSCPNAVNSKRTKIKRILAELQKFCPDIKTNIFRSIRRIKKEYLL